MQWLPGDRLFHRHLVGKRKLAGIFHRFKSTFYVDQLMVTSCLQDRYKDHGAIAPCAMHVVGFVFVYHLHAVVDIIEAGVFCICQVLGLVLCFFAHVEYVERSGFFIRSASSSALIDSI